MDCISLLPNDFLLQILSLLPTKDVLKTTVLSQRWRYLWKLVPKLEYIDIDENADYVRFLQFVDRSLLLNTAPVLESLHFKLCRGCSQLDIGVWVRIAVERGLRELNFDYCCAIAEPMRLPQSLYTCGTLVVLKLKRVSLVDVQFPVCFQLLKTLHLVFVDYLDDETPQKLLSSCPILEVLVLDRGDGDNVRSFSVKVPSLQRFIYVSEFVSELVMSTPSLKYFKTTDHGEKCVIEYMPKIVEAHIHYSWSNIKDILVPLKSLHRLSLCSPFVILCRVKGGKIGRASRGVDMGLRTTTMAKDAVKPGGYFGSEIPKSLAIIKCHQDEVFELPESATLLAYSDKCNVEMCSYGNHFLGIQGHPEYNKEILFEIIDRVVNMKLMEQDFADKAKATMENAEPDRKQWQTLCKNFLKGRSEQI